MQNVSEILDFSISTLLFLYLLTLIGKSTNYQRSYWFWGVVFVLFSKVNSVLEGLIFSTEINIVEHTFFFIACVFLFISIVKREL